MENKISTKTKHLKDLNVELLEKHKEIQKRRNQLFTEKDKNIKLKKELDETKRINTAVIAENKSRTKRILLKANEDLRQYEDLKTELKDLNIKMSDLKKRCQYLSYKNKSYKHYEDFIAKTCELLPSDYFSGFTDYNKLINRYKNLINSKHLIASYFNLNTEILNNIMDVFWDMYNNQEKTVLVKNLEITELYNQMNQFDDKIKTMENDVFEKQNQLRQKLKTFGRILRAIDNITLKAMTRKAILIKFRNDQEVLMEMTVTSKLAAIKNFILSAKSVLDNILGNE